MKTNYLEQADMSHRIARIALAAYCFDALDTALDTMVMNIEQGLSHGEFKRELSKGELDSLQKESEDDLKQWGPVSGTHAFDEDDEGNQIWF